MAKDKYCLGCKHYRNLYSGKQTVRRENYACHYILDIGHTRGCPFGEGCTHRTEKETKT